MIDIDEINKLIEDKRSFRIGGRGICIDCRFHFPSKTWVVDVPRAFLEMHCESISVCDDVEFTVLECHNHDDRDCTGIFDLSEYTKVTVKPC